MTSTSRRALAIPAIVAIAGFTATGPPADDPTEARLDVTVDHGRGSATASGRFVSRLACLLVVW
jgi:hypothetical protein